MGRPQRSSRLTQWTRLHSRGNPLRRNTSLLPSRCIKHCGYRCVRDGLSGPFIVKLLKNIVFKKHSRSTMLMTHFHVESAHLSIGLSRHTFTFHNAVFCYIISSP